PVRRNELGLVNFLEQERIVEVKYTDKVIHKVDIHLELIGGIEIEDNVDRDTIEEVIQSDEAEDLARPLSNEASHTIALMTSSADFMPMIVRPIFGDFTEDDSTKETEYTKTGYSRLLKRVACFLFVVRDEANYSFV